MAAISTSEPDSLPAVGLSHGGGPSFGIANGLDLGFGYLGPGQSTARSLGGLIRDVQKKHGDVKAILFVSAHWDAPHKPVRDGTPRELRSSGWSAAVQGGHRGQPITVPSSDDEKDGASAGGARDGLDKTAYSKGAVAHPIESNSSEVLAAPKAGAGTSEADHDGSRASARERPEASMAASSIAASTLSSPRLLFDYYGFPPDSFRVSVDPKRHPVALGVAREALRLLRQEAGASTWEDDARGWDHGVFVPLLAMSQGYYKKQKEGRTDKEDKEGRTDKEDKEGRTDKEDKEGRTGKEDKEGRTDKEDKEGRTDKEDKEGRTDKEDKEGRTDKEDKEGRTDKEEESKSHPIPVAVLSLHPGLRGDDHLRMGAALAPLREQGVLIVGSGSAGHRLGSGFDRLKREDPPDPTPMRHGSVFSWAREFETWLDTRFSRLVEPMARDADAEGEAGAKGGVDGAAVAARELAQWQSLGPHAGTMHPSPEHFLPFLVAAGAGAPGAVHRGLGPRIGQEWPAKPGAEAAGSEEKEGASGRESSGCIKRHEHMASGGALSQASWLFAGGLR